LNVMGSRTGGRWDVVRSTVHSATGLLLAGGLITACGVFGDDCGQTVRLRIAASQDKVGLLQASADDFSRDRKLDGKCVEVKVDAKNSGTGMQALVRGWNEKTDGPKPDVWSPASNVWGTMLRLRVQTAGKQSPIPESDSQPIMTSPLTIAMPRPMAEALGWPRKAIGWTDLAELAKDPKGWAAHGHPEWGPFKLGKTNPNLSTSGLHATVAAYFAATGTPTRDLTADDITNDKNRKFVGDIEKAIVHYGHTSLTFLTNLQRADDRGQAMSYISAVTVEEDSVWNYNQGNPSLEPSQLGRHAKPKIPLVAIYPSEGTIFSDHPYIPLSGMAADTKRLSDEFLKFLLTGPQQQRYQDHGYRDHQGRPGPKAVEANGLLPNEPKIKLSVPPGNAVNQVLDTWAGLRKPANVLLVLDRSGSMTETVPGTSTPQGELAKRAAAQSLGQFQEHDQVGLWMFSSRLRGDADYQELVPVGPMDENRRSQLRNRLQSLSFGGGTGLYNSAAAAYEYMRTHLKPGTINAVVFLTDGKNERPGGLDLEQLIGRLAADREDRQIRLFTIGFGKLADQQVLRQIAEATDGASYDAADPNTIDDIFTEVISNF
jgi:Ca-activated chloride channel homolog